MRELISRFEDDLRPYLFLWVCIGKRGAILPRDFRKRRHLNGMKKCIVLL